MACVEELHIDDIGTSLEFSVKECGSDGNHSIVDLTTASSLTVRFRKPDATVEDKTGTIYTGGVNGDATDGIIQYITETGFINITGLWRSQAIVEFPNGAKFHSSIVNITVINNL